MSSYGIFMIVSGIVVGGGWIAYLIWDRKMARAEAQQPKQRSERLKKTQSEVSDWAKKMAEFKSPAPPQKHFDDEKPQNG